VVGIAVRPDEVFGHRDAWRKSHTAAELVELPHELAGIRTVELGLEDGHDLAVDRLSVSASALSQAPIELSGKAEVERGHTPMISE
jgi:hypothetical protein